MSQKFKLNKCGLDSFLLGHYSLSDRPPFDSIGPPPEIVGILDKRAGPPLPPGTFYVRWSEEEGVSTWVFPDEIELLEDTDDHEEVPQLWSYGCAGDHD